MIDGKVCADAKVFNQLLGPDDPTKTITQEVATVFKPESKIPLQMVWPDHLQVIVTSSDRSEG